MKYIDNLNIIKKILTSNNLYDKLKNDLNSLEESLTILDTALFQQGVIFKDESILIRLPKEYKNSLKSSVIFGRNFLFNKCCELEFEERIEDLKETTLCLNCTTEISNLMFWKKLTYEESFNSLKQFLKSKLKFPFDFDVTFDFKLPLRFKKNLTNIKKALIENNFYDKTKDILEVLNQGLFVLETALFDHRIDFSDKSSLIRLPIEFIHNLYLLFMYERTNLHSKIIKIESGNDQSLMFLLDYYETNKEYKETKNEKLKSVISHYNYMLAIFNLLKRKETYKENFDNLKKDDKHHIDYDITFNFDNLYPLNI